MLGALIALLTVACSGDSGDLPAVPDFTPATTSTSGVDYSDVPLKPVPGKAPTLSVAFGPGKATLGGTVSSEEGAIPGATIQVERIVNGAVGLMMIQTAADGTWSLPHVLGGRYRMRAWRAPDAAQTSWTAVFLGASETKTVQLRVRTVGGLNVSAAIAPDPPQLGELVNLVVQVTVKVVDDKGVVRATPQDDVIVELSTGSGWRVESENPTATDFNGRAIWTLRCRGTGRQQMNITIGNQTVPLELSSCVEPAEEETTTTTAEVGLVP